MATIGDNTNGNNGQDIERIADKIRKLLAKGNDKAATQEEAEAFLEKASHLMEAYQISMAQVMVEEFGSGKTRVGSEEYWVPGLKVKLHYVETLAYASAILWDGATLVRTGNTYGKGTPITWVGTPDQIQSAKATFEYLWQTWRVVVERDLGRAKDQVEMTSGGRVKGRWTPKMTMDFRQGHGVGFANSVYWRCQKIADDRNRVVGEAGGDCTALVVVTKQALATWMDKNAGKPKKTTQSNGNADGLIAGMEAGRVVRLGDKKEMTDGKN